MNYDDRPWLRSYEPGIPADFPMPEQSLADVFWEIFKEVPDLPACYFLGQRLTYGQLGDLSQRFAGFLQQCGCRKGDVVGINLPNTPQYLIALLGTLLSGCAVTGVSPLMTGKEMVHQLNDCKASVLVTLDAIHEKRLALVQDDLPHLKQVVATNVGDWLPAYKRWLGKRLGKIPFGKVIPLRGKKVITFRELLRKTPARYDNVEIGPNDMAFIQYTGGTTGLPKGSVLTHRNILADMLQVAYWIHLEKSKEICCSAFPLFHLAGLCLCMNTIYTRNPQVLIPNPRDTRHICKELARYHPTALANVPSLYQILLREPQFKTLDFSRLKACISGAAPFTIESIRALEAVVGQGKVMEVFGMTEASPLITSNPYRGKKKVGTVGLPLPNTMVKIVDFAEPIREVPMGQEGELIAAGPQIMQGYYNNPKESAVALRSYQGKTWLFTGDAAKMDEEGYVTLVDRLKDMLIVGGYKVFSREVEEFLAEHPAVELIAIVGIPNPDRPGSQLVKAVIQTTPGYKGRDPKELTEEIVRHCKENMAPYKVPKIIQFIEQMPLTTVGKVDKKQLR